MKSATKGLTLELSAALWTLGLLTAAEIAEAAALEEHPASKALRRLTFSPPPQGAPAVDNQREETERLWLAALEELGIALPEPHQALLRVAKYYAAQVGAGEMEPCACAKMLWRLQLAVMQFPEELLCFIGFAGAWDAAKTPAKRAAVEKKIIEECRRLLDRQTLTAKVNE